ncbi:molybdopterin-dependent oxidoreductase [Escherichia coli]
MLRTCWDGARYPGYGKQGGVKPEEVDGRTRVWKASWIWAVTPGLPSSSTCPDSDIISPTATWYEKNDINTSDIHPFIHPLSAAVDPAGSESDWEIYKAIAKKFSEVRARPSGEETDIVTLPIQHD